MPRPDPTQPQPLPRPARLAAAALGRRLKLPAPLSPVQVLRDADVPMRDGATLRADVYLPTSSGPHPTVLLRSPYGRRAGFAVTMAVPSRSALGTVRSGSRTSPPTYTAAFQPA